MGRLDRRIQRLTARVKGRNASLQSARLARMTDEELVAEVARIAVKDGCPADQVPKDMDAAAAWCDESIRATLADMPEAERREFVAQHFKNPAPSGRPWV